MSKENEIKVLGKTFTSEEERRAYFREELRNKLPELREMEGFPLGEDEDIINLSDPPFYTACPNPWLDDFINEWENDKIKLEKEGKRFSDMRVVEPYSSDVSEGKNNPIYNAHSYHTKVPHPAIMRYILEYTQEGDIIFDGFSGTGMTGVAASLVGNPTERIKTEIDYKGNYNWGKRHAIIGDLSPIATYISNNLINVSHNPSSFKKLLEEMEREYSWMYKTKHLGVHYGKVLYTVWSEIVICENCGYEQNFLDLFIETGKILNESECEHCNTRIQRSKVTRKKKTEIDKVVGESCREIDLVPYLICYKYNGKRYTKKPDQEDLDLISKVNQLEIPNEVPTDFLIDGDKMSDPKNKYIDRIYKFYFKRTLIVLSALWSRANNEEKFYITNSISRNLTKLNRFVVNKHNPNGRINGPLTGTLYIPSEIVEQNPFEVISYKLYKSPYSLDKQLIYCGSATSIPNLKSNSVDYIFTDPPFGANIMYSELNFITESWLKVKTNNTMEAIQNKTQNKSIAAYQNLMTSSFKEFYRILKPNKWITIEFSNTSAAIWNCIQTALVNSGFIVANVSALDKVHGGIKAMRYAVAVKQDLIISCYKPSEEFNVRFNETYDSSIGVWEFVDEHLHHLPIHVVRENATTAIIERNPKILFDRLIAFYVQKGLNVPIDARKFQEGLRERYVERDGMFFSLDQVQDYDKKKLETPEFIQLGLFVTNEQDSIYWLRDLLSKEPRTEQDIHPFWMREVASNMKKGDVLPEMRTILEENFLRDDDSKWYVPDPENEADLEKLRIKRLLNTFREYQQVALTPRGKLKEVRVEALRAGFKQCYQDQDFKTIVAVGDRIPNNLLMEDEVLLQFYDIASAKV